MTYRVVQWTTGNVGRRSVHAIANNPDLELVGCYAWSPDKVGVDVGELAGTGPLGVVATDDIDALLALQPDCVVYNPLWPDVAELERILAAGINVVATAGFITGRALADDGQARIEAACRAGGVSIFGSGMNPGFANVLGLVSAGICDRVDSISVLESVDSTGYGSAETEQSVGYGRPVDDPELPAMVAAGTAVFGDAVAMMADALGVTLDDIRCEARFAAATKRLELGYMTIDAGCVAGVEAHWLGTMGDRIVIDLSVRWRKGDALDPDWPVEHGYLVRVEGSPCVKTKLEIRPPRDFVGRTMEDFMVLGMIMTALPAVQAIPAVCAAPPGIRTYADLPLITARGFVPGT
ncbi:MAG: dihydrodipicolinate reductase [Acidimicrobiales bacterium]